MNNVCSSLSHLKSDAFYCFHKLQWKGHSVTAAASDPTSRFSNVEIYILYFIRDFMVKRMTAYSSWTSHLISWRTKTLPIPPLNIVQTDLLLPLEGLVSGEFHWFRLFANMGRSKYMHDNFNKYAWMDFCNRFPRTCTLRHYFRKLHRSFSSLICNFRNDPFPNIRSSRDLTASL